MTSRTVRYDSPGLPATGCTIRITDTGTLTVHRDPDCAPDDVLELCAALLSGEMEITDLTDM